MSCTVWSNLSLQKDCNIQDFLEGHHASSCHFATSGRQVPLWFRGLPLNYPEREDDPVTGRTRSLEALRARGEKLASCSVSFSKQYWRFACLDLICFFLKYLPGRLLRTLKSCLALNMETWGMDLWAKVATCCMIWLCVYIIIYI